jgi:hypothetical protein
MSFSLGALPENVLVVAHSVVTSISIKEAIAEIIKLHFYRV